MVFSTQEFLLFTQELIPFTQEILPLTYYPRNYEHLTQETWGSLLMAVTPSLEDGTTDLY